MAPVIDIGSIFAEPDQWKQFQPPFANSLTKHNVDDNHLREQAENRLLNTQALIEYGIFKGRLISGIAESNKFFDPDDQISLQEYKFCTSLAFHKRLFVMEFRQIRSETDQCNHALELIFRGSSDSIGSDGHFTLILTRESKHFVWSQFRYTASCPFGTSKSLVGLILRWLQDDKSVSLPTVTTSTLS
jgi:hypothetical protein